MGGNLLKILFVSLSSMAVMAMKESQPSSKLGAGLSITNALRGFGKNRI